MKLSRSLLCLTALVLAPTASAATTAYLWMQPTKMQNSIETYGIRVYNHHYNVDTARCTSLRRYGVRAGNMFHGFKCQATTADTSSWTIWVLTSASGYYIDSFAINFMANPRVADCLDWGGTPKQCLTASG